jgi:hypothetical protein
MLLSFTNIDCAQASVEVQRLAAAARSVKILE